MSTTTLQRTISAVVDGRSVLSNSQFARPFVVPNWTTLRIALRLIMTNTTMTIVAPRLYVGICSGSAHPIMDPTTTDNWCGIVSGGEDWLYYAGGMPGSPVEYYNFSYRAATRVGAVFTQSAAPVIVNSSASLPCDAATANRTMLFVDITRGDPLYTFNVALYRQIDFAVVDVSDTDFNIWKRINLPTYPSHFGTGDAPPNNQTPQTMPVSEGPGVFDHVNIGWSIANPQIEICTDAIEKLA